MIFLFEWLIRKKGNENDNFNCVKKVERVIVFYFINYEDMYDMRCLDYDMCIFEV